MYLMLRNMLFVSSSPVVGRGYYHHGLTHDVCAIGRSSFSKSSSFRHHRGKASLAHSVATMSSGDSMNYKYVVVGGGNSAGYAARQFVENGVSKGDVCIIGAEPVAPYERPALSKAVLMDEDTRLPGFHTCVGGGGDKQLPEWYEEHGIDTIFSHEVTKLDVKEKRADLDDGRSVTASDAVIVATGCSAVVLSKNPGHDLAGIHYLRDNKQAVSLYDAMQEHIGKTVVIVGGGYIGMEVAAAAITVGCKVTMVLSHETLMSKLFTPEIAAPYEQLFRDKGVTFVKNGHASEFIADDSGSSVSGVVIDLKEGGEEKVSASLVVVGVGAQPQTGLLKEQVELDDKGGVIVNSSLRTSAEGVYAIGDIATFPLHMYDGKKTRMEHVQNARESATHVVNAIVKGDDQPYDYLPYFYSNVLHMSWKFYGDNDGDCIVVGKMDPEVLKDWSEDKGDHPQMLAVWVVDNDYVKGIFMESPSSEDIENMKRVARKRPSINADQFKKCSSVKEAWSLLL